MINIGDRIKKLRCEKNMSQEDLGKIFDEPKHQSTLGTWERGTREPSIEDIIKIGNYFHVSIDYLIGITNEKKSLEQYLKEKSEEKNSMVEFLEKDSVYFKNMKLRKNEKELVIRILNAIFFENE